MTNPNTTEASVLESAKLAKAFDMILAKNYGHNVAPAPYLTPSGFGRHVDSVLGGGLTSSLPILFTSSPESGKSTAAFQFCSNFQRSHPNSVIVYLDVETAASGGGINDNITSRVEVFGINKEKFLYRPLVITLEEVFQLINDLVEIKKKLENATGNEYQVLFIWDSLAATPLNKETQTDDPNQVIGLRARILTHLLSKYKSMFIMNRITLVIIDQIRSNIQITSPFAKKDEKGVGTFTNFKAASNINALQHSISQWIYFSKKTSLFPNDGLMLDGWVLELFTEKNKQAPSHYDIQVVFDKKYGIIPLLSEYHFMGNMSTWEKKITGNKADKLIYPYCVTVEGKSKVIVVYDPKDTKSILVKTEKFTEKNLISLYNSDEKFRAIFELALKYSIQERILKGYFREIVKTKVVTDAVTQETKIIAVDPVSIDEAEEPSPTSYYPEISEDESETNFDPDTGEIYMDDEPQENFYDEGIAPEI
jgi:RecA/RadA recombinase